MHLSLGEAVVHFTHGSCALTMSRATALIVDLPFALYLVTKMSRNLILDLMVAGLKF